MAGAAAGVIRAMTVADADSVAALIREAFSQLPVVIDPPSGALRETAASVAVHLESGGGAVVDEGGPVACVLWEERDGALYIGRLAVAPGRRGRGIAAQLVEAAADEARLRALPRLRLGVRLALEGNRRLFLRLGFVEVGMRLHEGYAAPTSVDMERTLR